MKIHQRLTYIGTLIGKMLFDEYRDSHSAHNMPTTSFLTFKISFHTQIKKSDRSLTLICILLNIKRIF